MHTYVEMRSKNTNVKDIQQYENGDFSKERRDWNLPGAEQGLQFHL